jgi:hypothetical protein
MTRKQALFDQTLPDTSAGYREKIAANEAKRAKLHDELAQLEADSEYIEVSLLLDHEGAEAHAAEHYEKIRKLKEKIDLAGRARARGDVNLVQAQTEERKAIADARRAELKDVVREIQAIAPAFDMHAAGAAGAHKRLRELHRQLAFYRDLLGPESPGAPSAYILRAALAAAGGHDLMHALELPAVMPEHRLSLTERMRRRFKKILAIGTIAETRAQRIAAAGDKAAEIEKQILRDRPDLEIDADEPVDEIRRKGARLNALIVEALEA